MNARYEAEAMNVGLVANASLKYGTGSMMTGERVPFTIRLVRTEEELGKAVQIRHVAYGRHVPGLAELLRVPEPQDRERGSVILLAESKLDGSPVGTMRIHTNRYGKLPLEGSVALPGWLHGKSLIEATRLGVIDGRIGHVVKMMLIKACFKYCVQEDIDWMVIVSRSPLDRQYEAALFQDVFAPREFIPMRHVGNIPHRVMSFEVATAEARWAAARHPLHDFICRTHHPDIDIGERDLDLARVNVRLPMSFHADAIAA